VGRARVHRGELLGSQLRRQLGLPGVATV
jgi:hypothetical protein